MTFWAKNKITVWTATIDEWGQPSYANPRVILGTYRGTSRIMLNDAGEQFAPMQEFMLLEAVNKGDYIAAGEFGGNPPKGTGRVKKVDVFPPQLGRTSTQYRAYTA